MKAWMTFYRSTVLQCAVHPHLLIYRGHVCKEYVLLVAGRGSQYRTQSCLIKIWHEMNLVINIYTFLSSLTVNHPRLFQCWMIHHPCICWNILIFLPVIWCYINENNSSLCMYSGWQAGLGVMSQSQVFFFSWIGKFINHFNRSNLCFLWFLQIE